MYGKPRQWGHPFGDGAAACLDYMLDLGRELGFRVANDDYFAGHIEYGEGEELVGILCHLDVVPAGEGWSYPPFQATFEGDRLYGRGTQDNKGPAVVALYCLKMLKDQGITPKRRIRLILGCSEESGMEDMEHYFSSYPIPDYAFSPDADTRCITAKKVFSPFG